MQTVNKRLVNKQAMRILIIPKGYLIYGFGNSHNCMNCLARLSETLFDLLDNRLYMFKILFADTPLSVCLSGLTCKLSYLHVGILKITVITLLALNWQKCLIGLTGNFLFKLHNIVKFTICLIFFNYII